MLYCGDQLNFTDIWIDEGINQCILDTITSGILFLLMFICGCLQCSMYRKYSTQVDTNTVKGTVGFTFQVSFLEKKQKQKTTNKQKTNDVYGIMVSIYIYLHTSSQATASVA